MESFGFDTFSAPAIGNDILDIGLRRRRHTPAAVSGGAWMRHPASAAGPGAMALGMTEAELLGRPGEFDLPAVPDVSSPSSKREVCGFINRMD
jgi:hypothetical protein